MTFDETVNALVRSTNCSRDQAIALVRSQMPQLTPPPAETTKDERILEKEEQWECMKIYRAFGCIVYSTSQSRAAKVSPGIPDLLVFLPRAHQFWYHEVKRQVGGEQSPAQREFQEYCADCGIAYILGDRSVAQQQLVDLEVAILVDGKLEPAHLYQPRGARSA